MDKPEQRIAEMSDELTQLRREKQIQTALERVRAKGMAMHHTEELQEVILVVFQQLKQLGIQMDVSFLEVFDDDKDTNIWVANPQHSYAQLVHIPFFKNPIMQRMLDARKNNEEFFTDEYSKGVKNRFYRRCFKHSDLKQIPEIFQSEILNRRGYARSTALTKHAALAMFNLDNKPYSDEENDILTRFSSVFEQTYTRFLDLQKAEAQAREAQIEAALERVRSRTMAMHQSDELSDVVGTLYDQLALLDIADIGCNIAIFDKINTGIELWMSAFDDIVLPRGYMIKGINHPYIQKAWDSWRLQASPFHISSKGAELKEYIEFLLNETDLKSLPDDFKDGMYGLDEAQITYINFEYGQISEVNSVKPLSEEKVDILSRFAKVFEQTYTRFLDLQKAEAQAREAQIEAALERVRAASMAMHQSSELIDISQVIYQQICELGIKIEGAGFHVDYRKDDDFNIFAVDATSNYPARFHIPYLDHPAWNLLRDAKEKNLDLLTIHLTQEEKNRMWDHYVEHYNLGKLPKKLLDIRYGGAGYDASNILLKEVNLFIWNDLGVPFSDKENDIFIRFGQVLEQTYTRFLDLQKAEAQAREAQIEAALERVRSRTMGMQKSEELNEIIQVVYEQFVHLNINIEHTGFIIDYKARDDMNIWLADQHEIPSQVTIPYFDSEHWNSFNEAKEKGMDFFANNLNFEEKNKFYQKLFELIPGLTEETKEYYFSCPGLAISTVLLENVGLYIENFSGIPYSDEENNTLMRFGNVFQQTYTRFLDLQKAEERAREAEIEASMERMRSRAMAMHKSDELADVVAVIFEELKILNFDPTLCAIGIYDEDTKGADWWISVSSEGVLPRSYHMAYLDGEWFHEVYDVWKNQMPHYVFEMSGDLKKKHDKLSMEQTDMKYLPEDVKSMLRDVESFKAFYISMRHGLLEVVTEDNLTNAQIELLQRFTKVIDLTYTRVDDLQKAEAREKEAVRQASLDRIRGEIASMRHTDDLLRITPLIWKELTVLRIPFFRCGVFIMDEDKKEVQAFLANPEGEALTTLTLPFDSAETTKDLVTQWRAQKVYSHVWDQDGYLAFFESMMKQGHVSNADIIENPPEELNLQFFPFRQGMLYVGSEQPLDTDQYEMMNRMARTFQSAYNRYEDFRLIEEAKQGAEQALGELKSTQNQLIQAEKMASLGELTAGIAHEIQNPLNFVNNFSEVSRELIDEIKEEKAKSKEHGDEELIMEILGDIEQNLEKINHHGERASSIVKGMLSHSRASSGERTMTDINALCDEYLRLAYHGLRAKDKSFNASYETDFDENLPKIEVASQDIGRVILNLINNAFYAVNEKKAKMDDQYEPKVSVATKRADSPPVGGAGGKGGHIQITVKDNGNGIPKESIDKIFQPFFTTKPTGKGTGLGLSLSYDIVKAQGGELKVVSTEGRGSEFTVKLPA